MMRSARAGARRSRERGSAALEAAVLIPLAMGVLVVIVQIFAMAYASHGVSQAARDGARAYSASPSRLGHPPSW